ncbi:Protein of unknown function (DUF551) [butyrate-producing bacterium SS3/4]|nr:Protein of unknown function (DUF551) [butyrate-producing bacterium SS3/4]
MNRLTEKINNWRWRLKGVDRKQITPGAEITDEVWRKLYGALCRLKDYEDTGLMPDEIERMKGKERQQWISVEERLPEENKSVLLYMKSRSSSGTCIQTGSIDKGFWFTQSYPGLQGLANREFHVMAWMPLPEPYTEGKE